MKDQLQTIREALNLALNSLLSEATKYEHPLIKQALTALAELERLAGEPVAWKHDCAALLTNDVELWVDNCPHCGKPSAAPPAQQPQGVDWEKLYRLEVKKKEALAAKYERDTGRKLTCIVPMAQQPQARPDFNDEWTGYLKDGETPFERFLRERKDLDALTKLYQRALEENERLKAQQPQAELLKSLEGLLEAAEWLTSGFDEESLSDDVCRAMQCARATIAKVTVSAAPQQAEAVPPRPDIIEKLTYHARERDDMTLDDCLSYMNTNGWHKVRGRTERELILQITALLAAAPPAQQPQAQAVPLDVVRDAERYRWLFSGHTEDELNADALAGRQPTMTAQDQLIADFSAWYTLKKTADAKIDAAMAQGEKP